MVEKGTSRARNSATEQPARKQRHIQSINVGFRLIEALIQTEQPLSLKDLAEQTEFSTGHAFLYMTSFLQLGLVSQDESTSRYDLGPLAFDLGLAAIRRADVVKLSEEPMRRLYADTGESVFLSVWGNRGPTIVNKLDGGHGMPVEIIIGFVLSLLETATGQVFVAYLPRLRTQRLVESALRAGPQVSNLSLTAARVEQIANRIRKAGFNSTGPHRRDNFASIAAPVFDHSGALRATLTLTGLRDNFEKRTQAYRTTVIKHAIELSEMLGYRPVTASAPRRKPTTVR
jgi:DNA-binding IclR family transcriptional regulator